MSRGPFFFFLVEYHERVSSLFQVERPEAIQDSFQPVFWLERTQFSGFYPSKLLLLYVCDRSEVMVLVSSSCFFYLNLGLGALQKWCCIPY